MNDIQAFTQAILAKKQMALSKQLLDIEAKELMRFNDEKERLMKQCDLNKQHIDTQQNDAYQIKMQAIENDTRNVVLQEKRAALLTLFDKAYDRMLKEDATKIEQSIHQVMQQLDANQTYTLYLGEKTPYAGNVPNHVTLADSFIPNEAGFLLESNGVSYNYLFSTIIDTLKNETIGILAKRLDG